MSNQAGRQPEPAFGGSSELLRGRGTVRRMPVNDEIHRPGRVVQKALAEVDERRGAGVSLINSEPQRAFRGHHGDHVH